MAEQLPDSDDGEGSTGMEVKQATFYKWKYRHYFTVVEKGDKLGVNCAHQVTKHCLVLAILLQTL